MSAKNKLRMRVLLSTLMIILLADVQKANPATPAIDPYSYPFISDQEMGQLRWTLKVANQARDDYPHPVCRSI